MREMHEVMEMAMMNKKRKRDTLYKIKEAEKKMKALKEQEQMQDQELDSSILDPDDEEDEEEDEEEEEEEEEEEVGGWKIDTTASNSRKIGALEVQVLGEDPLDPLRAFSVSQAADKFKSVADAKNPRVKYANFAAQKRKHKGPSKAFVCK
ncbi:hypothetical protein B484DRAFT_452228 [Ochromonadaceae sp. CCMP2298]|nr:hypothetical protein B484DRAFT_452228 [Ochromonadaceae sp. CCMP2298]